MVVLKIKKSRMDDIILPIKNDGISNFDECLDTNRLTQMDRWDDLVEVLTREEVLKIEEDGDCVKFEFVD
jgi:hypothetical protein